MDYKKLNWGIIGAGIIAEKMADALHQNKYSNLLAVASKAIQRAQSFADKNTVPIACSYTEIVNNNDIDIIYVATTHNFHFENAKLALEYGKHVLVEKAFTVNAKEAETLANIAKEKNLFLMEAIWVRFLPSYILLKKLLSEGIIGDIKQINISFGNFVPPMYEKRLTDPALAGGVTLDMGIYPISFACYMMGELPAEVKSMTRFSDSGVDEISNYMFKFPSGCISTINTSYNLGMKRTAFIYGSKGYIEFPDFQFGEKFNIHTHSGTNEIESSEEIVENNHENGFIYQVEEVVKCINEGKIESSIIPVQESIDIMKLMDGMRKEWGFKYPFED
ncbi:MAG: Gfo/Idh/MocA family oxidoreductase [Spirochaetales bacterium]|nr:Gfo/Idh/MocA family oxidoreductase [Spirochaetales bacterium]